MAIDDEQSWSLHGDNEPSIDLKITAATKAGCRNTLRRRTNRTGAVTSAMKYRVQFVLGIFGQICCRQPGEHCPSSPLRREANRILSTFPHQCNLHSCLHIAAYTSFLPSGRHPQKLCLIWYRNQGPSLYNRASQRDLLIVTESAALGHRS